MTCCILAIIVWVKVPQQHNMSQQLTTCTTC